MEPSPRPQTGLGAIQCSSCLQWRKMQSSGSELWSTSAAGGPVIFTRAEFDQRLPCTIFLWVITRYLHRIFPAWDLRLNDVFFAGSLRKKAGERRGIFRLASPKEVVRSDLVHALKRFAEEKQWAVRLVLVTGFAPYALATEVGAEGGRVMTPENYMKEMANSKICLAPRGTSLETFRHYEAASVGSVSIGQASSHLVLSECSVCLCQ
jgi:hypothetical protein